MKIFPLLLLLIGSIFCAQAEDDPRWVQNGASYLNKERTNDTYQFVSFHLHKADIDAMYQDKLEPLLKYVETNYPVTWGSCKAEPASIGDRQGYRISYENTEGQPAAVYALLVDTFEKYEDYEDGIFEWEYYELFALSYPGKEPRFDEFAISQKYNGKAVALSIIPGLGQMYKGQKTKGWVILGGEVALVGATVAFEIKQHYCADQMTKHPEVADSWKSKRNGWRTMRDVSIGCAAALYIYNLIDAGASRGARTIKVSPSAIDTAPALALSLTF